MLYFDVIGPIWNEWITLFSLECLKLMNSSSPLLNKLHVTLLQVDLRFGYLGMQIMCQYDEKSRRLLKDR